MSTSFYLRVVTLNDEGRGIGNALVDGDNYRFDGNALTTFLCRNYTYLTMTGENGTLGDVGAPDYDQQPWIIAQSVENHTRLKEFLMDSIIDPDFDNLDYSTRGQIRALLNLVKTALLFQGALERAKANTIITVSWS